jgi:hypothetical protein
MNFLVEVGTLNDLEDVFGYFIKVIIDLIPLFWCNLRASNQISPARKVRNQPALKARGKLLNANNRSLIEDFVVAPLASFLVVKRLTLGKSILIALLEQRNPVLAKGFRLAITLKVFRGQRVFHQENLPRKPCPVAAENRERRPEPPLAPRRVVLEEIAEEISDAF